MRLTNTTNLPKIALRGPALARFAAHRPNVHPALGYSIAVASVIVTLIIRLIMDPFIEAQVPFVLFAVAVVVPAWIGGMRPGIVATLLSCAVINYFFLGTHYTFGWPKSGELLALITFFAEGSFLSWAISALRQSQQHSEIAYQEMADSQQRLALLGEASALLSTSLNYQTTLKNVAGAVVPALADWCAVDIRNDQGGVERLAVVHSDPAKIALAEEFQRRYPADPDSDQGINAVLRHGKTVYVPHIPDAVLVEHAIDDTHLQMMRALEMHSYIIAPLVSHDHILGAITLVGSSARPPYDQHDVVFVEELARRAAMAVDNSRLFHEGQQLNAQLERRVQERTEELETALRDLRIFSAKLEVSNRELEEFASVASHDLQEPLRKVQAFGDRLKIKAGPSLSDEGRDYLERMQNAAGRMQTLINDLLTFSRVTSKGQPFVPVNLAVIARDVVSDLETRIEQTGARVEVGELPTIDADPLQMRQLLQNLLGNALKFHRKDVALVVCISSTMINQHDETTGSVVPYCRMTVTDNGIGFDEKYLDRIFNVFQRLHARSEYEGTGVGLAVCRRIAERHHGTITAESAPGQGATFIVMLPVQQHAGEYSE